MTSSAERKKVLVIGATGNQGGGLITHLLTTKEWYPVALTRNPDSPSARSLANRGVEIMKGDMDDLDSLRVAIRGSHGVFSVQNENTIETEIEQGRGVIEICVEENVNHLVYTASCGAKEPNRGVDYWDSKRVIIESVRESGLPYTILRPVSFMENYISNRAALREGNINGLLTPDKELQVISGYDIGLYASQALARPGEFIGQEIDIASETITMTRIAETLSTVVGSDINYTQTEIGTGVSSGALAMSRWYQEFGYDEDISKLKDRWKINTLTFHDWLNMINFNLEK
ncbi:MAG: NmrA/HSCARG family protein [Chloroflexota bacterium]|nr:NmrA/HSCARG family protein [Chloroflexota bacterium]